MTRTIPTDAVILAANADGHFATSVPIGKVVTKPPSRQAPPAYETRSYLPTDVKVVETVVQGVKAVQDGWSPDDERRARTGTCVEEPLGLPLSTVLVRNR